MRGMHREEQSKNKGMSLIEIVVAVGILSIALIPLMGAFVYSIRYNARSKELQKATELAQTVMESLKVQGVTKEGTAAAAGIDTAYATGALTAGWTVGSASVSQVIRRDADGIEVMDAEGHPVYDTQYSLKGVKPQGQTSEGSATYWVDLTLTEGETLIASDAVSLGSGAEGSTVFRTRSMSTANAAIYDAANDLYAKDQEALNAAVGKLQEISGSLSYSSLSAEDRERITEADFNAQKAHLLNLNTASFADFKLRRRLNFTIVYDPGDPDEALPSGVAVSSASVSYEIVEYRYLKLTVAEDGTLLAARSAPVDAGSAPIAVPVSDSTLNMNGLARDAVYIFYYPRYTGYASAVANVQGRFEDVISISVNSAESSALNLYLYKQINEDTFGDIGHGAALDGGYLYNEEINYHPNVYVTSAGTEDSPKVYVNTNLRDNLANASSGAGSCYYYNHDVPGDKVFWLDGDSAEAFDALLEDTAGGGLTARKTLSYSVNIKVYSTETAEDGSPQRGTLLVDMDGSFLNK